MSRLFVKTSYATLVLLIMGGCGEPADPIQVTVDSTLVSPFAPTQGEGSYERPLAAVAMLDENGVLIPDTDNTFVENELLLNVENFDEVEPLLIERGWTDFTTDAVDGYLDDVEGLTDAERAEFAKVSQVVVRLPDLPEPSSEAWKTQAAEMIEDSGHYVFSSENAVRLFALISELYDDGYRVSANFVGLADAPGERVDTTSDGGGVNYFSDPVYANFGAQSSVRQAWQYLWMRQDAPYEPVNLAIIDGGFYFDENGAPVEGVSDFRGNPLSGKVAQVDLEEGDNTANRRNPSHCTGGSECPYHGRMTATVSSAILNNGIASAGTGGIVAKPILIHIDLRLSEMVRGIGAAIAFHADVVSMSFGLHCGNRFCDFGVRRSNLGEKVGQAYDAGTTLVSAAGNENREFHADTNDYPCVYSKVMCVGATLPNSMQRISYSNYGSAQVEIFAPTEIPVEIPNNEGVFGPGLGTGTSASTPFMAGVVAMMKAVNRDLTPDEIRTIIAETAWQSDETGDPTVTRAVNAFQAIRVAGGMQMPPDRFATTGYVDFGVLADGVLVEQDQLTFESPTSYKQIRFELPMRADVEIRVETVEAFGDSGLHFATSSGSFMPVRTDYSPQGAHVVRLENLPAGHYAFRVFPLSDDPSPERLFHVNLQASFDNTAYPDVFDQVMNRNDSPRYATVIGRRTGVTRLNHELGIDHDWLRLRIGVEEGDPDEYLFSILAADYPVVGEVYVGSSGDESTRVDAQTHVSRVAEWVFELPGEYLIHTYASEVRTGEYLVRYGEGRKGPRPHLSGGGYSQGNIWTIPTELTWIDFAFLQDPEFFESAPGSLPPPQVILEGGAHLIYLDRETGEILGEGVPQLDLQGNYQEVLLLSPEAQARNGFVGVFPKSSSSVSFGAWSEGFEPIETVNLIRLGWFSL